jgi:hypothetical protein
MRFQVAGDFFQAAQYSLKAGGAIFLESGWCNIPWKRVVQYSLEAGGAIFLGSGWRNIP